MKTVLISILGFFLVIHCNSSPAPTSTSVGKTAKVIQSATEQINNGIQRHQKTDLYESQHKNGSQHPIADNQNVTTSVSPNKEPNNGTTDRVSIEDHREDVIVIDLEKINKMSPGEFIGRQVRALWDYLLQGKKEEKKGTFVARCIGIAKKIRQIMPVIMIGGGVIITKLAFLVLFSLKTLGLLGLLLLINVGSAAAKLGALFALKKDHSAQNLHFHVQSSKSHDHEYSSHHLSGAPYGWDDRSDVDIQGHELYNLYEKLKMEQSLKRYFSTVGGH